jgi:hypothetical protein
MVKSNLSSRREVQKYQDRKEAAYVPFLPSPKCTCRNFSRTTKEIGG